MARSTFMQFHVITPGLFTTVQDLGRKGYLRYGVPVSGALDTFSARIANYLVANDDNCAVLETTVIGPSLLAMNDAFIAVTGAEAEVKINGQNENTWKAIRVRPGDKIEVGSVRSGCRNYIAVTGGIQVDPILGSRSCYIGGRFGGTGGRPVKDGDKLMRGIGTFRQREIQLPSEMIPRYPDKMVIRAISGPQADHFQEGFERFFSADFTVSQDANRSGYRLEGPHIACRDNVPASIISESSIPGAIQVPPNGQPIILLREQTVGGYAKIAAIVSADLDLIGQAPPGTTVRFDHIDLRTAHKLVVKKQEVLIRIQSVIDNMARISPRFWDIPIYGQDRQLMQYQEIYPGC